MPKHMTPAERDHCIVLWRAGATPGQVGRGVHPRPRDDPATCIAPECKEGGALDVDKSHVTCKFAMFEKVSTQFQESQK